MLWADGSEVELDALSVDDHDDAGSVGAGGGR